MFNYNSKFIFYVFAVSVNRSFKDVRNRIQPLLSLLSKTNYDVLIIAHQAVCRVLYSCLADVPLGDCVNTKIDLHTLYTIKDGKMCIVSKL